jgi:cytidylate kinase
VKPDKISLVPDAAGVDDADSATGSTAPATRWSIDPQQIAAELSHRSPQAGNTLLITIDGPAGAGKSTYAAELTTALSESGNPTAVITMDDLYAGWDGLLDPDLEHNLRQWIVQPLQAAQAIRHPVFDWTQGRYGAEREVPTVSALIVEGVGAGQPVLSNEADLKLWLAAPKTAREQRLRQRGGPSPDEWWPKWQLQETAYFRRHDPAGQADQTITSVH